MSFIDELNAGDKHGLFKSDDTYVTYSTGILPLDYANGFWQEAIGPNGEPILVPVTGVTGGTVITIIGFTGTGKTTFGLQMGYNIIKPFKNSTMHVIDTEKTANRQRLSRITQSIYEDPRLILKKENTSIEDVLKMFDRVCEIKEDGGKTYMYQVPGHDGKPVWVYIPTVFMIDSLPNFNSAEFNTEDLGSNTDGMRGAKDVTRFFTNVLDRAWKYNVTFIVINHIRPKTEMNQYAPMPRGLMMLGPSEQLPRGAVAQYYSNTFFRINMVKSSAYTVEDNGFKGYKATIQLAKSKTNQVGTSFHVAYLGEDGFDSWYTIYEFAADNGLIKGKNPYLYIDGLEALKFNRKDFRTLIATNEQFRNAVLWRLKPFLEQLLGTPSVKSEQSDTPVFEYGGISKLPDTIDGNPYIKQEEPVSE